MSVKINGSGIITGLDADGISAQPVFPGNVLQVVMGSTTTQTNIASTSYQDSGLSATITPTSASSKILIIVSQCLNSFSGDSAVRLQDVRLLRNSTEISTKTNRAYAALGSNGFVETAINADFAVLDSPNTTSAVTYKTQGNISSTANSALIQYQSGNTQSTITLMEIAA
jgi:hypothetical protein